MDTFKSWLRRWQEPVVWLPALALLALLAWLVLGALDPAATLESLPRLIELPIQTAYALAALALVYLARRRWRRKLSDDEQADLWRRTVDGEFGAIVIYLTDTLVTLVCIGLLLRFFSS